MTKILILYWSAYGHVEQMAEAVAEGARAVEGAEVTIKRVPELVVRGGRQAVRLQARPERRRSRPSDELADYDAIIFGTPTRFGNMAAQMRNFLDQTGGLWAAAARWSARSAACSPARATQHGGQETTITSFHTTLLHQGMVVVGLPYTCQAQMTLDEITGGSPVRRHHDRRPATARASRSENELGMARFQGEHVARIASEACRVARGWRFR